VKYKNIVGNSVFISLCCALGYYTFFGKNNLYEYFKQKKMCVLEQQRIAKLKRDIKQINHMQHAWKQNPESLEQHARLDLCMGHTNELVYLLPKKPVPRAS